RRASTPVGKPIASRDGKKSSSSSSGGGAKGIGCNRNGAQRSSVDGSTFVASPPRRPRSKSVGGVHTARLRKSPGKSPRRISKSKDARGDRDADPTTTAASVATVVDDTSLAADAPTAVPTSVGG
ncbi:unnamed protein product, partial [Pylaiella littoralis]